MKGATGGVSDVSDVRYKFWPKVETVFVSTIWQEHIPHSQLTPHNVVLL